MISYVINGVEVINIENQDLTLYWKGKGIESEISNIRLFDDAKDLILNLLQNQNVFEKIKFEVKINNEIIYSGYFSFRNDHELSGLCDYIELSATRERSNRSLEDLADNATIQGGIASGRITPINVSYQLSTIPDNIAVAVALTGIVFTTYSLQQIIKNIAKDTTVGGSNPFTVNVLLGTVIEIAYAVTFLATLVIYVKQLIEALVPDVNETQAINVYDAMAALMNQLGYTLGQTDYETTLRNQAIILSRSEFGNLTNWTLRDLIEFVKKYTNTELVTNGNVVSFKKRYEIPTSGYVIEDYKLISKRLDLNDCPSSILIRFTYDSADLNTATIQGGNSIQAIFNRHGDGNIIELPVARAKRKDELTRVEKIILAFLKSIDVILNLLIEAVNLVIRVINTAVSAANKIIKSINKVIGTRIKLISITLTPLQKPNFAKKIADRIGNLLTEADTWGVEKLAILENGKISANSKNIVNAETIYNNYYSERYVYEIIEIETLICYHDIKLIIENQSVTLNGYNWGLEELSYEVQGGKANLKLYRAKFRDTYVPNIIVT